MGREPLLICVRSAAMLLSWAEEPLVRLAIESEPFVEAASSGGLALPALHEDVHAGELALVFAKAFESLDMFVRARTVEVAVPTR
jgi:hypothetical protein